MKLSKSLIDNSGKALARNDETDVDKYILYTDTFDEYRKNHLEPLSKMTIDLQRWLSKFGKDYFIAQRIKRKPQILRKLKRFSVRLSQLQDIGGTRIIVEQNKDVDELVQFLKTYFSDNKELNIIRMTDYRGEGREDSGYRAYHVVIERDGYKMELQIRSKIQHYWAETIERTSIVYGHHLKELEGDPDVILYFKTLSDVGAREILRTLERRHFWGTKTISRDTLKNHFCQGIITFDSSLDNLVEKGLVLQGTGISLNLKRKQDINKYVY